MSSRCESLESRRLFAQTLLPGLGTTAAGGFLAARHGLVFAANTPDRGTELWRTDGTPEGTVPLAERTAGTKSTKFGGFINLGDQVVFSVVRPTTQELWLTDGSDGGTRRLATFSDDASGQPRHFSEFAGRVYFAVGSRTQHLYVTDGTVEGTRQAFAGVGQSIIFSDVAATRNRLYFARYLDEPGEGRDRMQLWRSDGTEPGTFPVVSVQPAGFLPDFGMGNLTTSGKRLFFTTYDRDRALYRVWRTDGTAASTVSISGSGGILTSLTGYAGRLAYVHAGLLRVASGDPDDYQILSRVDSRNDELLEVGSALYYIGVTPSNSTNTTYSLFMFDPTVAALPVALKNLGSGGAYQLRTDGTNLFFSIYQNSSRSDWWRTDGTAPGTRLLATGEERTHGGSTAVLYRDRLLYTAARSNADQRLFALPTNTGGIAGRLFADNNEDGLNNDAVALPRYRVFLDQNGNGSLDDGESATRSGTNGSYRFDSLAPGLYTVRVISLDANQRWTTAGGVKQRVRVFAGAETRATFGATGPGTFGRIRGSVYIDHNNNGVRDADEEPVTQGQVGVGGYDPAAIAPDGTFIINGVRPGRSSVYTARLTSFGLEDVHQSVDLSPGSEVSVSIGVRRLHVVAITYFNDLNGNGSRDADEPGIPDLDVTVVASQQGDYSGLNDHLTAKTDSDGVATYLVPDFQEYSIFSPKASGWRHRHYNSIQVTPVPAGRTLGAFALSQTAVINGRLFVDSNGNGYGDGAEEEVAGWYVYLDRNRNGVRDAGEMKQRSDEQGQYTFDLLEPGTYCLAYESRDDRYSPMSPAGQMITLKPGDSHWVRLGMAKPTAVLRAKVAHDLDGNSTLGSSDPRLSGFRVWIDLNRNGRLDGLDRHARTNSDGVVEFSGLMPGRYVLNVTLVEGWTGDLQISAQLRMDASSSKTFLLQRTS